jgi:LPXTG-motif cell wall-anchored protein
MGMLTSAVTGNTVIGYMPPLLYYALNIGMGPKLGSFYLFSMVTGSYTAKLWLFIAGLLMMAAALFYQRLRKRMA